MNSVLVVLLVSATLGSGLMAGLFCSFSNFMMQALSRIPAPKGIAAMQSINLVIVKPAFLLVFFGTAVACALSLVIGWKQLNISALVWTACGGAIYAIGCLVVTMAFNVPLNNRLAAVDADSDEGAKMWQTYLVQWTRWNHVRSIATIASTILLVMAVFSANVHV